MVRPDRHTAVPPLLPGSTTSRHGERSLRWETVLQSDRPGPGAVFLTAKAAVVSTGALASSHRGPTDPDSGSRGCRGARHLRRSLDIPDSNVRGSDSHGSG